MKRDCSIHTGRSTCDIADLPNLDRTALVEQWHLVYGGNPPANISRPLMMQAIAYRMQEKLLGGLKPATRKLLIKIAEDQSAGRETSMPVVWAVAGTRLLREWHGTTYEVVVQKKGVLFAGKQYRSLTEVARAITGVHWSGPKFFGLKEKRAKI